MVLTVYLPATLKPARNSQKSFRCAGAVIRRDRIGSFRSKCQALHLGQAQYVT